MAEGKGKAANPNTAKNAAKSAGTGIVGTVATAGVGKKAGASANQSGTAANQPAKPAANSTTAPSAAGSAKYVVEGATVKCNLGSATTTLVGTSNSRIGNQLRIIETDTTSASFAGTFGICKTLTAKNGGTPAPCQMALLPKWYETNDKFVSSSGAPCVTTNSFAVCKAGAGWIEAVTDGQTVENFNPDTGADLEVEPTTGVSVNIIDYAKAMGAIVTEHSYNGEARVKITYENITQDYVLNNGLIDDLDINEAFGWDSFLTEQYRKAGVGIAIKDDTLYYDITIPMTRLFHDAKRQAQEERMSLGGMWWFKDKVNHNAEWDIKRADPWSRSVGTTYPGAHDAQVYFNGDYTTPEDLGNLLYGYAGSAVGLSYVMLSVGSFHAAGYRRDENELRDREIIKKGIQMYDDGF